MIDPSIKCDFPKCEKEITMRFTTGDGVLHKYCSIDHANDYRNVLIGDLMNGRL